VGPRKIKQITGGGGGKKFKKNCEKEGGKKFFENNEVECRNPWVMVGSE